MTTPTRVNTDLMDATFTEISENLGGWNQNNWSACFAAHTVEVAAAQGLSVNEEANAADEAQRLLGLDMDQAERLFFCETDLEAVGQVISWIKGEFPLEDLQPTMDMHLDLINSDLSWILESKGQPEVLKAIIRRSIRERELVSA